MFLGCRSCTAAENSAFPNPFQTRSVRAGLSFAGCRPSCAPLPHPDPRGRMDGQPSGNKRMALRRGGSGDCGPNAGGRSQKGAGRPGRLAHGARRCGERRSRAQSAPAFRLAVGRQLVKPEKRCRVPALELPDLDGALRLVRDKKRFAPHGRDGRSRPRPGGDGLGASLTGRGWPVESLFRERVRGTRTENPGE